MSVIILFGILGLVMVVLEVFVPGGVLGSIGGLCLIAALVFSYLRYGVDGGAITLIALAVAVAISYYFAIKLVPRTRLGKTLFLQSTQKGSSTLEEELEGFVGRKGTALTYLRPSGMVKVDGRRLNAISDGEFIPKKTPVEVVRIKSNQVLVRKLEQKGEST